VFDGWNDEQLLGALRESLVASREVSPEAIAAARSAYAWRNFDTELAQLIYDSSRDWELAVSRQPETATVRAFTFVSAQLTIELEASDGSLLGQVVPVQRGTVEVQASTGEVTTVAVDGLGCFTVRPLPAAPFRLHCRTVDGSDMLTGLIAI
jgi:hypothetical protein